MSGTINHIGDPGLLAGIGTVAIDGTFFNVSDVNYSDTNIEYEYLKGYNGVHGRKGSFTTNWIKFKVRDAFSMSVSAFQQMINSEVLVNLANGKVISGAGLCCMKAIEVDANEAQFEVTFEGPPGSVTGT